MGFMLSIVSAGTVILQTAINGLGYLIIAGHTAARKLFSFCMMPVATISLSLSTFVSQNKGADQGDRIIKAVRYGNLLSLLWCIIISVILFFGAESMVRILSGSNESIVIENGAK